MKLILQSQASECGLVSLAMIASHFNKPNDIHSLRNAYPQSLKGMTLEQIIGAASDIGLATRPLSLELGEINQLALPCILHWDLNHFVVLKKVTKQYVVLLDPAFGEKKLAINEFANHFTGIALELSLDKNFVQPQIEKHLSMSDIKPSFNGLAPELTKLLGLSAMIQFVVLLAPYYMQTIIDDVLVAYDTQLLVVLATAFALLHIFKVLFSLLRGAIIIHLGTSISRQLSDMLFSHLIKLPLQYFESRFVADIVSRFQSIEHIKRLLATKFVESIIDGCMAIITVSVLFAYDTTLASITVVFILLYFIVRWLSYFPFKRASEQLIRTSANEQAYFMESIKAIQSIKLLALENRRKSQWLNHFVNALNSRVRIEQLNLYFFSTNTLLFGIENIIIIYLGASMILTTPDTSLFTLGMLTAFLAYKNQVVNSSVALIETFVEFKMLSLHLSRIADIALEPPEETRRIAAKQDIDGNVTLHDVSFKYPMDSDHTFCHLNLSVFTGESIAITGRSGSGKSTLLKVIVGLFRVNQGKIMFGQQERGQIDQKFFCRYVSTVMQNDQLITGSIAENIAQFDQTIDLKKVKQCAQLAHIHDDIHSLPMAYDSIIGDMGAALSVGQVQRILIARALYRTPKILILDEATSNLDLATEKKINNNLRSLGITIIFVAHRLESILQADRIFELSSHCLIDKTKEFKNPTHTTTATLNGD